MKTFLAALAAALIGGGAAIGAVALNLVPVQKQANQVSADVQPLDGEETPVPKTNADYEKQIQDLNQKIEALEVQLSKKDDSASRAEVDALKAQIAKLNRPAAPAGEVTEGETAEGSPPAAAPADPQFEAAVRDVYAKIEEERVEQRRTERQAQRLEQLEQAKQRASEFIPKLVEARASALNIPEASIPDVSAALVTHAQYRAEILSEIEGKRIDGEEVDREANQKKLEELNETTIAALTSYVDEETAKNLVGAVSRAGRDNNNQRGPARRGGGNR
ncbi:MAG: hypothetical protein KDB82_13800 [Planctomycetes bacterium]|nr:hypothetical protein [Planctomycetota bacterium]